MSFDIFSPYISNVRRFYKKFKALKCVLRNIFHKTRFLYFIF
nr:MAG TPA: hypothetical protein [Caudoviricetes sp.]